MARIRSVHPGLFTDEAFVSCSPLARLLYIGLWTEADDGGAFEWKPVTIKMRLLPVDNADIPTLLAELDAANMVKRYASGGREYGAVRNFCRYQRPKKPKLTHPMPAEFRTYVGSDTTSTEPEVPDDGPSGELTGFQRTTVSPKGEPDPPDEAAVPKKARISPQMEDGGGRGGDKAAAPQQPRAGADDPERPSARLDRILAACSEALGDHAPADPVIGPIALLVDRGANLDEVLTVLRSEAQRPRRQPIRTWKLWADKVAEQLAGAPTVAVAPPKAEDPNDPLVRLSDTVAWPESLVGKYVERFVSHEAWPDAIGPEPGRPGCRVPNRLLPERLRQSDEARH